MFLDKLHSHPALKNGEWRSFIEDSLPILGDYLNVSRVGVWFFNEDGSQLESFYNFDVKTRAQIDKAHLLTSDYPIYFGALSTSRTIYSNDVNFDPGVFSEFCDNYFSVLKIFSILDAGIYMAGKLVGVICLENVNQSVKWSNETIYISGIVADMISSSITIDRFNKINQENILKSKLASIGEISSEILHEVSNPISLLSLSLHSLKSEFAKQSLSDHCAKLLDSAIFSSEHVVSIFNAMRSLLVSESKINVSSNSNNEIVSLKLVLEQIESLISSRLKLQKIRFFWDQQIELLYIHSDKTIVGQIFLNLIKNSMDAVSHMENAWIKVEAHEEESKLKVYISDSGLGIPPHIAEKMFETFFTSKSDSGGTGLGLPLCRRLAQQLSGKLEYLSEKDNTTFLLTLPI